MSSTPQSALIRRLAIASLAGQLLWVVLVTCAGVIEPGYSELRDPVSFLGADNAARPWLFNLLVGIWGASFIAAAAALLLDAPRGWRGRLGPALIAFTGISQILAGFPFPADCRATIDPWCEARELAGEVSWQHASSWWPARTPKPTTTGSPSASPWRPAGSGSRR